MLRNSQVTPEGRSRPALKSQAQQVWRWLLAALRTFLPAPLRPCGADAERVLSRARMEALQGGFEYIGGEHVLAAILAQPQSLAALVLARVEEELQARLDRLPPATRAELPRSLGSPRLSIAADLVQLRPARPSGTHPRATDHLPYTNRLQTALRLAGDEAQALGHEQLNSAHLLLGLLAEEGGIAAHILESAGVESGVVRAALLSVAQNGA